MPALLQPGRKALCNPVWQGIREGILQERSACEAVRSKGEGVDILSERIKKRKNELKLTYDQIADQLFVTRVAVQNWGLGKALPNSDRIPDICRILQCTPNYLFGFSDVPSEQPVDKDINVHNNDIISRQAAIDAITRTVERGTRMKVGLIDVDNYEKIGQCYPNLPLMKLSAWHKQRGDSVEWYQPLFSGHMDKVYMSKVFSFTPDYPYYIDADEIERGGTGYCISVVNGKEVFDQSKNINLPDEIEHIYPDYDLYGIKDTAYGFMSRGCPRGCGFCHVKDKEGLCSRKVADLSEFWRGQKNIQLCDPNTLACPEWKDILQQLIDSHAWVDFNQGVDIRLMTDEKAEMLKQIRIKQIHFAYDRYQDKEMIEPKFRMLRDITGWDKHKVAVYCLTGFDTTIEQDLDRIMFLRSLNFSPYVMIYNKESVPKGHVLRKLQRWCNNRFIFWSCPTFEEYQKRGERRDG